MKNKIWIIAWTPMDTHLWVRFIKSIYNNIDVYSYAISKDPNDQNLLQLNMKDELYRLCLKKCNEFKNKGVSKIIIYCNSLSSSININKLKKEISLRIITPLDVYENIWTYWKNILLLTANSVWAILPERILRKNNKEVKIVSIWYLELVNSIELEEMPKTIISHLGLNDILKFSNNINIDFILLACTHFPYITDELKKWTKIRILDLNEGFEKILRKTTQSSQS